MGIRGHGLMSIDRTQRPESTRDRSTTANALTDLRHFGMVERCSGAWARVGP